MAVPSSNQLRLLYSLLKPVARAAARFRVPMRTLAELTRLAYYEHLRNGGLSQARVARRLGQTDRHMRSLERRLRSDFFAAEREIGLTREIENRLAQGRASKEQLQRSLDAWGAEAIDSALDELVAEGRAAHDEKGTYALARRYVLLSSDQFHHRIDALNHFLDTTQAAVVHRLVYDESDGVMLKTITFCANREELERFRQRLEGELRVAVAELEEKARFEGQEERFSIAIALSPVEAQAVAATDPDD